MSEARSSHATTSSVGRLHGHRSRPMPGEPSSHTLIPMAKTLSLFLGVNVPPSTPRLENYIKAGLMADRKEQKAELRDE